MGVSCVIPVETDGRGAQQIVESLHKRLEFLGAEKTGTYSVDAETFQATPIIDPTSKSLHVLHSSDFPTASFAILEDGSCLVAENSLDALIGKLKSFYVPRKAGKIEVKGAKFSMTDFTIKIGNVTQSSNFRGVLIEVVYEPCCDASQCWSLLAEFITNVIDRQLKVPTAPPQLVRDQTTGLFSTADTMLQYVDTLALNKK